MQKRYYPGHLQSVQPIDYHHIQTSGRLLRGLLQVRHMFLRIRLMCVSLCVGQRWRFEPISIFIMKLDACLLLELSRWIPCRIRPVLQISTVHDCAKLGISYFRNWIVAIGCIGTYLCLKSLLKCSAWKCHRNQPDCFIIWIIDSSNQI